MKEEDGLCNGWFANERQSLVVLLLFLGISKSSRNVFASVSKAPDVKVSRNIENMINKRCRSVAGRGTPSRARNWAQKLIVQGDMSPVDLPQTLLVDGGLLVLCSLAGPPVIKQLMQMVTMVPGQGGQFQSVCFL